MIIIAFCTRLLFAKVKRTFITKENRNNDIYLSLNSLADAMRRTLVDLISRVYIISESESSDFIISFDSISLSASFHIQVHQHSASSKNHHDQASHLER